jgi:predicted metal-dependent hydrolase
MSMALVDQQNSQTSQTSDDGDCQRLLEIGRDAFERGEYHRAHELWEDAWHRLRGPERLWVQGLIQLAAALHHLDNDRPRPAARLADKAAAKLADAPESLGRFALGAIRREAARLIGVRCGR